VGLINPAEIHTATDDDLYTALGALNEELRCRVDRDGGLAAAVRAVCPTAVAVLCDVEHSSGYPTAAPEGVLLADGTTVWIERDDEDDTARQAWLVTCDEVANLAAVDGAIIDDFEHGWMVPFATAHGTADGGAVSPDASEAPVRA
jgi:hypothetical protein